jgi:type II secretory pathway pseudopilin PulG
MNKKGYTLPELLVLLGVVSVIAIISIVKISFAFSDINNKDEIEKQEETLIEKASMSYANTIIDRIKDEKVVYITGSDLMDAGFLAEDEEYNILKIKLSYDEEQDKINYEVISSNGN